MTYRPVTPAEIRALAGSSSYLVLLKPAIAYRFIAAFNRRLLVVHTAGDLERAYPTLMERGHKILIQEIVPGPDENLAEVCLFRNEDGGLQEIFTARKLEQYPARFGTGTVFKSCRLPDLEEVGRRLAEALDFQGLGFAEFKMDARTGRWCLIEFNPRTTHCNELSAHCGVNFPLIAYRDMLGESPPPSERIVEDMVWINHLERAISAGRIHSPAAAKGYRTIDAVWAQDDPTPALGYAVSLLGARLRGRAEYGA